jgi:hypothetical protein
VPRCTGRRAPDRAVGARGMVAAGALAETCGRLPRPLDEALALVDGWRALCLDPPLSPLRVPPRGEPLNGTRVSDHVAIPETIAPLVHRSQLLAELSVVTLWQRLSSVLLPVRRCENWMVSRWVP